MKFLYLTACCISLAVAVPSPQFAANPSNPLEVNPNTIEHNKHTEPGNANPNGSANPSSLNACGSCDAGRVCCVNNLNKNDSHPVKTCNYSSDCAT
ncbi:hypothetical protein HIM_03198 [Hirsutella minnesotensis 3608]|nr:hypothetical protein HIM_03198 [Hirsutella minnesotensis 3608]